MTPNASIPVDEQIALIFGEPVSGHPYGDFPKRIFQSRHDKERICEIERDIAGSKLDPLSKVRLSIACLNALAA